MGGIETTYSVKSQESPLAIPVLENIFLVVYMIELLLRLYAWGWKVLKNNWVRFDLFLVVCGVLDFFIRYVVVTLESFVMDKVMLVRLFRLFRLVRAARL